MRKRRIIQHSAGRHFLINDFESVCTELSKFSKFKILVIGGSAESEPEIRLLENKGLIFTATGTEDENFLFRDINSEVLRIGEFNLVICNQVLEHIWNHNYFLETLKVNTKKGSLVWVTYPFSNRYHKSPEYYSAGFSPEYLESNMKIRGFETIKKNNYGSLRYYFLIHMMPIWPTISELKRPYLLLKYINKEMSIQELLHLLLCIIFSLFLPWRFSENQRYSTESLLLMIRK